MTLQEQIRSNRIRTAIVILGFAVLVGALALAVANLYDPGTAGVVGIAGIGYGLFAYVGAGRLVATAAGAHDVGRDEAPELHRAVENAAIAAGLAATPRICVIDDAAPNAMAAGRTPETSFVAATTGLLAMMDQRELEGVMAHEIAHVRNRDVRLMTIVAVLVGVVMLVTDMLMRISFWGGMGTRRRDSDLGPVGAIVGIVVLVLAPIVALTLQMMLSRRREFLADASAVEITGDPDALASALQKLANDTNALHTVTRATAHMYIESPLRDHVGLRSGLGGLFDTHPPIEERIERLRQMGAAVAAPTA